MLPKKEKGNKHVYFVCPIRYKKKVMGISRQLFVRALNAEGIPFGAGYVRPIYLEPLYQKKIAYGKKGCPFSCRFYGKNIQYCKGDCLRAEAYYRKCLSIPLYPSMIDDDISKVLVAIREIGL